MGFVDRMDENSAKYRLGMSIKTYKITNFLNLHLEANSEAYSEPCQTSKKKVLEKTVSAFSFWIFLQKAPS